MTFIHKRVNLLRMTQKQLGKALGVSERTIRRYDQFANIPRQTELALKWLLASLTEKCDE